MWHGHDAGSYAMESDWKVTNVCAGEELFHEFKPIVLRSGFRNDMHSVPFRSRRWKFARSRSWCLFDERRRLPLPLVIPLQLRNDLLNWRAEINFQSLLSREFKTARIDAQLM